MGYTKNFLDIDKYDVALAGGKGASLGEMMQAGISVPPGFVILSNAFELFLEKANLLQEIEAVFRMVDHEQVHTVENASEKIQALITAAKVPSDICESIEENFAELDVEFVAVRSSATVEDGVAAAWAGQLESYLNTTREHLIENVKKCWASLFTPRAIFYRFEKGLHGQEISVAVVVQKMVASETAGVAFSVHPVTQDRNQLIIEAVMGLGEALVSGQVTPDSYVVEKKEKKIIDKNIQDATQKLSDQEILELSDLVVHIENHYGFPVDIEWAREDGKFYIVQSRPITTLSNVGDKSKQISLPELTTPRKRKLAPSPAHWNAILQTSQQTKEIYGTTLSFEYNYYSQGDGNMIFPAKEWQELGDVIAKKMAYQEGYFEHLENKTASAKSHLFQFIESYQDLDTHDIDFKQLLSIANTCKELFMEYDAASVFAWFAAGDSFKKIVEEKTGLNPNELDIVSMPEESTFASQMEREVMKAALGSEPIDVCAQNLYEKFYWIPFGYDGPTIWDRRYFVEKIEEYKADPDLKQKLQEVVAREWRMKKEASDIINKYKTESDQLRFIHILKTIAVWTDERKRLEYPLFIIYHKVLKEFSERYGLNLEELKYLLTDELEALDKNSQKLKKTAVERVAGEFSFKIENGKVQFISNMEMEKVKSAIFQDLNVEMLIGNIACKGTKSLYQARVKVLKSSHEAEKIQKGDILVATMTTPEYVPAMNQALGFVTDEGGVTCHAAIVAREMNKPCIIGTKLATQFLKDGDEIEMDTDKGVVRILKRASV